MKIGIDILNIKKFSHSVEISGARFLNKIFTLRELVDKDPTHLCGVFSAKESLIKIGVIKVGEWQKVEILNDGFGKPIVFVSGKSKKEINISISHTDEVVVSVALIND